MLSLTDIIVLQRVSTVSQDANLLEKDERLEEPYKRQTDQHPNLFNADSNPNFCIGCNDYYYVIVECAFVHCQRLCDNWFRLECR